MLTKQVMQYQWRSQTGFTLIELMVAIFITAIIGSISATMLTTMIDNHQQVKQHEKNLTNLERTLQVIRADIENIAIRPATKAAVKTTNYSANPTTSQMLGSERTFEFSIYRRVPSEKEIQGQLHRVRYSVTEDKLIRESIGTDFPDANQQWHSSQLLSDVTSIEFKYFFDRWEDNISATANNYPRAVQLIINTTRWKNIELIVPTSGVFSQ
jgi:general secretion pathway protein J